MLLAILVTAGEPVRAQTPPPIPSPSPSPQGLNVRGSFRAYDFTRQNASKGIGGAGQVNQQSIELGLALHADYTFAKWFSIGGTYELAQPTNGCGNPTAHLSPPCGRVKAPGLNPDDTLPGFDLRALYEAYVQYKGPHLMVKAGGQVFNTPWTSPSDTRIKPTAFQGVDVNYALSPVWSLGASDMLRFEGRVNSTFERNTLLTSFPAGTAGVPADIFVPGGTSIPTAGLQNLRVAYAGTKGFVSARAVQRTEDPSDVDVERQAADRLRDAVVPRVRQLRSLAVAFRGEPGCNVLRAPAAPGNVQRAPAALSLRLASGDERDVVRRVAAVPLQPRADGIRLLNAGDAAIRAHRARRIVYSSPTSGESFVNPAIQAVALAALVAAGTEYTVVDAQGHVVGTLTTDAPVATSSQMRVIGIAKSARPADGAAPIDKAFHPNYTNALTVEQMTRAWHDELDRLNPPIVTGGG